MEPKVMSIRAAAIQLEAEVGNLDANLTMCEALADAAARDGAEWIILPEFFSSGIGYLPQLRDGAPPADGAPLQLLVDLARRHGAHVGGSAIVRDDDDHVRNAFFLVGPDGEVRGRHDKDIPTMWENTVYTGGGDPGRIDAGDVTAGVALCWEFMRTQTADRLAGRVDLVVGGSGWWSIPPWWPRPLTRAMEAANVRRAERAAPTLAPHVGAPVVHAAHSGVVNCPMPLMPLVYHGHFQGAASISDARGEVLAIRRRAEGPGHVIANVPLERAEPVPTTDRFWLQERGIVASALWTYQGALGRSQYRRAYERRLAARAGAAPSARDEVTA